jgi:putative addiction module component (TIGR02574 family)
MMSGSTVRAAALKLGRRERATLARDLIASLDEESGSVEDVEAAWLDEVERRVESADRGEGGFEPWEVVEQRIAARLRDVPR